MKNKLLLFAFAIFALSATFPTNWETLVDNESITIEYKESACKNQQNGTNNQYIVLKFTNKTNHNLSVEFTNEVWYNEKCANCTTEKEENNKVIQLAPHQKIEGTCTSDKTLKVFSKMNNGLSKTALTKYSIKNIKISQIN